MRKPKEAVSTAQQKQMLKGAKTKPLGRFEASKLFNIGKRDGLHALPKQDENGVWTSPLLQKEANAYSEFCSITWGSLQAELDDEHREIDRLYREISRLEDQLASLRKNAPVLTDAELSDRKLGEEKLSETIIRNRRQKAFDKRHSGYFNQIRQVETELDGNYRRMIELQTTVQSAEQLARLTCERVLNHTKLRATEYWHGAISTHLKASQLPPTPVLPDSGVEAEALYLAQHELTETAVNKMIERKNRIADKKTNRTEDYYVSTQKSNRKRK